MSLFEPRLRDLASALTADALSPLDPRCEVVQFRSALRANEYRAVGEWLGGYPTVTLRAYGSYDGSITEVASARARWRLVQADRTLGGPEPPSEGCHVDTEAPISGGSVQI